MQGEKCTCAQVNIGINRTPVCTGTVTRSGKTGREDGETRKKRVAGKF